jgi:hypothetical protein
LSVCLSACLSVCLPVCPSVRLSVCPSVRFAYFGREIIGGKSATGGDKPKFGAAAQYSTMEYVWRDSEVSESMPKALVRPEFVGFFDVHDISRRTSASPEVVTMDPETELRLAHFKAPGEGPFCCLWGPWERTYVKDTSFLDFAHSIGFNDTCGMGR